jgi:ribonucleoside-diphosphate reductase alpha chain
MKTYTEEEVREATLKYFKGNELATNVAMTKYLLKNRNGEYIEKSPDEIHRRLAKEFARIEQKYSNPMSESEIYEYFKGFKYLIAQGSPMAAIGNEERILSVSNCFTLPSPLDSYGSIMHTDEMMVHLSKSRGGVGFDISNLRPKDQPVMNAAVTSSGIKLFMERYSNTIREVGQSGRRGALLLSCSVHHPDIKEFIESKRDEVSITGANISVRFSDDFMNAVKNDLEYEQYWPMEGVIQISRMVRAKELWDLFIECAWERAEPGALFWDTVTRNTPSDAYEEFKSVSANPCSEIVQGSYDSCRLSLINLCNFVKNPYTKEAEFEWDKFKKASKALQRLMDDIVDLEIEQINKKLAKIESDPEPPAVKLIEKNLWLNILDKAIRARRTGSGITALGDTLAMLGLNYGSDESIKMTESIYKTLSQSVYEATIEMAEERGPFDAYNYEKDSKSPFILSRLDILSDEYKEKYKKYGRRNIALTTTAPAGSVSCLAAILNLHGTTSGIEPAFMAEYIRRRKLSPFDTEETVDFVDKLGDKWHNFTVLHQGESLWRELSDGGTSPYIDSIASKINWEKGVELQAVSQSHIDQAISKTCNLPSDATKQTVNDCYMKAWELGCKGFTVYRDGCRSGVLISTDQKKERSTTKRPEKLSCEIHHASVKGEQWIVFVGMLDGQPYELMGGKASTVSIPRKYKEGLIRKQSFKTKPSRYDLLYGDGGVVQDVVKVFDNAEHSVYTRLISLGLRHGAEPTFLVEQLSKDPDSDFQSFSKAIGRVLKKYIKDGTKVNSEKICESCGDEAMVYMEGCKTCKSCGWCKCS